MAQTADKPTTAASTSAAAKAPSAKAARSFSKPAAKPAVKKAAGAAEGKATREAKRAPTAPAKAVKPAKASRPLKAAKPKAEAPVAKSVPKAVDPKQKLVRDSFTMPRADFDLIDQLKTRALSFHRPAKKSELLRAGLQALAALNDADLARSLSGLTPLKAGRPRKQS